MRTNQSDGKLNLNKSHYKYLKLNHFYFMPFLIQYSIVYFEPDGDLRYKFNSKPKLVTVPDTEIMQVIVIFMPKQSQ